MIIRNWLFELIAVVLLIIFVITGVLMVRRTVRIKSLAVRQAQEINEHPEKGSKARVKALEGSGMSLEEVEENLKREAE